MEGYFETPRHAGLVGGVGTGITGFDLTDIDAGVVNLRVVDRPTARVVRGKAKKSKAKVKKVSSKESSEDDGDDGIWNAKREDDIVEMDEPLDMLADADAVVQAACQQSPTRKCTAVCIHGGPVSRVELLKMPMQMFDCLHCVICLLCWNKTARQAEVFRVQLRHKGGGEGGTGKKRRRLLVGSHSDTQPTGGWIAGGGR